MIDHNYFEILGLAEQYTQDVEQINQKLTHLQSSVHPDNYAKATAQEKRLMMQYSAMINEAYATLKDPIQRAIHLLELRGMVLDNDTTKALESDFLEHQMNLRESLEDISDDHQALDAFEEKIKRTYQGMLSDLSPLLDVKNANYLIRAREKVLHCQFYQKLLHEIKQLRNTAKN